MIIAVTLSENNEIDFLFECEKNKPSTSPSSSSQSPEPPVEYARPQFSSIIERIERAYVTYLARRSHIFLIQFNLTSQKDTQRVQRVPERLEKERERARTKVGVRMRTRTLASTI